MQTAALQTTPQSSIDLPGIKKLRSGKVREVFDLGDTLLFVVSDRLSAFDVILPDPIPFKGAVLNQISAFWFKRFQKIENHFVTADFDEFPNNLKKFRDQLAGRSMIVRKTTPLTVECVVRGYLAGSGWKEYQQSQSVCGIKLPPSLQLASPLPKAIFTPSTKAEQGHDENIDMNECRRLLGDESATRARATHRRVIQAKAIQSDPGRRTGRGHVGDAKRLHRQRAGGSRQRISIEAPGLASDPKGKFAPRNSREEAAR